MKIAHRHRILTSAALVTAGALVLAPAAVATAVAPTPIDQTTYSVGGGAAAFLDDGTIVAIDATGDSVIRYSRDDDDTLWSAPIGEPVTDIAIDPDGTRVFVSTDTAIHVLFTSTGVSQAVYMAGAQSIAISPDGLTIWIVNDGSIERLDMASMPPTPDLVASTGGTGGGDIVVAPDGSRAYATAAGVSTLWSIDTATNAVTPTSLAAPGGALAVGGINALLVALPSVNRVDMFIRSTTLFHVMPFPGFATPAGIAITPDGTHAIVANAGAARVDVIDFESLMLAAPIATTSPLTSIAYAPDGSAAAGATAGDLYVIDLVVSAPVFAFTLPDGELGTFYDEMAITGGIPDATVTLFSGSLPPGLALASDGRLFGTPTAGGSFSFIVEADNGISGLRAYAIDIAAAATLVTSLPTGTMGAFYTTGTVASSGYPAPTLSLTGTLPLGLTFAPSTGVISGTPTEHGSFEVEVTAANGSTVTETLTLEIHAPAVLATTLPGAQLGTLYTAQTVVDPGFPAGNYTLSGALPAGLGFEPSTGTISGTPSEHGSFEIEVTAANGGATATLELVVTAPADLVSTLPTGALGTFYTAPTVTDPGYPTSTYTIAGELPAGIEFDTLTGTLSGTPTEHGSFEIEVTAANGSTVTETLTLEIHAPAVLATTLPGAHVGTAYTAQTVVDPGFPAGNYTLSGALPAGLAFDPSTGTISGTPTASGDFTIQVTAVNGGATAALEVAVGADAEIAETGVSVLDALMWSGALLAAGALALVVRLRARRRAA